MGASSVVDGEGFVRSKGHTVWWGGSGPRIEEFPEGNTGYQVLRTDLDRVLLDLARANGARVGVETTIQGMERDGKVYRLHQATTGNPAPIRARWILDCSGRSGVIARRGFRHQEETASPSPYGARPRRAPARLRHLRIQQFPDVIVARNLHFQEADLLEFEGCRTQKGRLDRLSVNSLCGPAPGVAARPCTSNKSRTTSSICSSRSSPLDYGSRYGCLWLCSKGSHSA